jgi:hypothetical protein
MSAGNENWKTGSSCSPHARVLNNRLAYEVLETIYHLIPAGTRGGPALDDPLNIPPALHEYQNWLHARLREAGLAKALAAGPDFLPDITLELPPFWRFIARLTAPRSYRRLTEQVVRNLAWYLGEGTPPVTLAYKLRSALLPAVFMTILLLASLMGATGLGQQPWPVILLCGLLLLALILGAVWNYGADTTGRFRADCAELYAYLLEAYAEPGPDSENLVQSLLVELGRDTDNSNEALARRARKRSGTGRMM